MAYSDSSSSLRFTKRLAMMGISPQPEYSVNAAMMRTILRHIPGLHSLNLRNLFFKLSTSPDPLVVISHSKPTLPKMTIFSAESLKIANNFTSFSYFRGMYDPLSLFSHIDYLEVEDTSYGMLDTIPLPLLDESVSSAVVDYIRIALPTLSSLRFDCISQPVSFFFYTVVRLSSTHSLRRLCVIGHQDINSIFLSRLLREATVLEELYLDLEFDSIPVRELDRSTFWDSFNLSECRYLRKLFLPIYIPHRYHRAWFKIMINLLSTIPKSTPLRILGLPLDVQLISDELPSEAIDINGEPEGFELACLRIFGTRLDWTYLARNIQGFPQLKEVAIGVMTKDVRGRDIDFGDTSVGFIDRMHEILEGKLLREVPERIHVRVQQFNGGEF